MSASDVIARLRELRAKATAGEWFAADWTYDFGSGLTTIEAREPETLSEGQSSIWPDQVRKVLVAETQGGTNPLEDAAAIVAAMNSLESLLACAEALQGLLYHAGIHDADPEDHDDSDHTLERRARAALQALAEGGGE
jgi:hypothetical protein